MLVVEISTKYIPKSEEKKYIQGVITLLVKQLIE